MSSSRNDHPQQLHEQEFPDPKSPDYEPVPFTHEPGTMPNCDFFLGQYMRCVSSKPGLSHVDDCPEEGWAYKECIEIERDMGIGLKQRYYRDSGFWDLALDNIRVKLGFRSNNPEHATYVAPSKPTLSPTNNQNPV